MGIKAAYKQCQKPIVYEKSQESLLQAKPLRNAACLCVCLKYAYCKHRSPFNKAFNNIPKSTLVLNAWSLSQELFGIANWHSYTLAPSGRYSLDQGKRFFRGWITAARKTAKHIWAKELICLHRGPGDQHLLHGGLKLCKDVPSSSRTKWKKSVLCWDADPARRRRLLLQQLWRCEQPCKALWQKAARFMPAAQLVQANPGSFASRTATTVTSGNRLVTPSSDTALCTVNTNFYPDCFLHSLKWGVDTNMSLSRLMWAWAASTIIYTSMNQDRRKGR